MSRNDKLVEVVVQSLQPGETLAKSTTGASELVVHGKLMRVPGLLFASNQRVGFLAKWLGGSNLASIRFKHISSMTSQFNSLTGLAMVEVTSANEALKIANIKASVATEIIAFIESHRSETPHSDAVAPSTDLTKLLLELSDLRDRGILSEEEFEQKKREIVERM